MQHPKESLESFQRAIQFDPCYIPSRVLLAQSYLKQGQYELAEIEITSARSYGGGRGGLDCASAVW
jgi:Tfp pilus assembly protein PilF